MTFDEADDFTVSLGISFDHKENISADMTELDVLDINLLMPWLFIDVETLEPI